MTSLDRLRHCGRSVIAVAECVGIVVDRGEAHFTGVQTCGSVWSCPTCAAAIRERKSLRLQALSTAAIRLGYRLEFAVLTMPHGRSDRLDALMNAGSAAWASVTGSRAWRASGVVGFVRAWEITDGHNGWHPHMNALAIFEPGTTDEQVHQWRAGLSEGWANGIERELGSRPSAEHGVVVSTVAARADGSADVAAYLAKVQDGFDARTSWGVGREVLRGDVKRAGRKNPNARRCSPFELAERAVAGDRVARARWLEYEAATFGRRCLEESRSARWKAFLAELALDEDQGDELVTDPADSPTAAVVAELSHGEWQLVTRYAGQLRLLDQAEAHGLDGVLAYLHALRLRQRHEDRLAVRRHPPQVVRHA